MSVAIEVSEHARERFVARAERLDLTPTVEEAWRQAYELPDAACVRGEVARYDPTTRCVFPVRDGEVKTAIYAPTARPAIRRAVRNAGWWP